MPMRVLHVGVGASCERNADLFFQELLGLEKAAPVSLSVELSRSIFAIERELAIIHYRAEGIHFEVFVDPSCRAPAPTVAHTCLEADDPDGLLVRCTALGLRVNRTPKGDSSVTFISDLDGNLYEVKKRK
ncbi:MAG: hypothetical protein MUF02_02295 [Acidobacteria bacterium]|nr:hypothetical protein [Acidobacteriota bacterium]